DIPLANCGPRTGDVLAGGVGHRRGGVPRLLPRRAGTRGWGAGRDRNCGTGHRARTRLDAGLRVANAAVLFLRRRNVRCDSETDRFDATGDRDTFYRPPDLLHPSVAK